MSLARRFLSDRGGSTAIEYALIAALIGVAILAALGGTTNSIADAFQSVLQRVEAILAAKT